MGGGNGQIRPRATGSGGSRPDPMKAASAASSTGSGGSLQGRAEREVRQGGRRRKEARRWPGGGLLRRGCRSRWRDARGGGGRGPLEAREGAPPWSRRHGAGTSGPDRGPGEPGTGLARGEGWLGCGEATCRLPVGPGHWLRRRRPVGVRHLAAVGLAGVENEAEVGGWLQLEVGGGSRGRRRRCPAAWRRPLGARRRGRTARCKPKFSQVCLIYMKL